MKYLLLLALLLASPNESYVYICMGPRSECYHKTQSCRGLRNCSTSIKKVTVSEAKTKYHRRACGICMK